jgi:hypothetical protein
MVDGQIAYRDGIFPRFKDGERIVRDAEKIGKKALNAAGLSGRLEPAWRQ